MTMRRSYLEVEGPHDVEFVARLLPPSFKRVQMLADLDPALRCLVPAKFPHRDDLLRRVPVPTLPGLMRYLSSADAQSGKRVSSRWPL